MMKRPKKVFWKVFGVHGVKPCAASSQGLDMSSTYIGTALRRLVIENELPL
jgi:hypothetical protein